MSVWNLPEWIQRLYADGDLVTGDDGFVLYWPEGRKGALNAVALRALADELDRRNAPHQAQLDKFFEEVKAPDLSDFAVGDAVRYVPYHACGDRLHSDCEDGTVTRVSSEFVFVRFKGEHCVPQACKPDQLARME